MKISFQEYPPPENFFHIIIFIHNFPFSEGIYLCIHKEDTNMANEIKTVDELRGAYPALVDQIEQAAALRATNAERQRIRDIEEMALPGSEQITNEAKYDKPMSASDYAKAAMKNAKEQGAAWLNTMQQGANASGVNSVGSAPAPTGGEKPDEFMDAIKGLGKKQ